MAKFQEVVNVRPAVPSDKESIQTLVANDIGRKGEGIESWLAKTAQCPHLSLVAEVEGRVVGWILGWPDRAGEETKLRFDVKVEESPTESAIHRDLLKALVHASSSVAVQLRISLFDTEVQLLTALHGEGFVEDHRTIFSRLTLAEADIDKAETALSRCTEQGLALSEISLRGLDQPDFWDRLSSVHNTVMLGGAKDYDDPRPQFATESVQAFIGGGQFPGLRGRMFIAHRGHEVIGYATVFHEGKALHHGYTGVDPAYRRNGIGLALKAMIFRYARQQGVDYLDTGNREDNVPVISLNKSLGYRPEGVQLHMWKHLGHASQGHG